MTLAAAFQAWLVFLGPIEGGLSLDPMDPGNWTGGRPGDGFLRGSNGGISAAAYPTLDIGALTQDQIDALRKSDYWDEVHGDFLPAPLAFAVADAAYMSGPDRATRQMQQALGVTVDGDIGDQTTHAALSFPTSEFLIEFAALRLLFLITLPDWPHNKAGWTRRLFRGVTAALALQGVA
jgi:lysozyme family protein